MSHPINSSGVGKAHMAHPTTGVGITSVTAERTARDDQHRTTFTVGIFIDTRFAEGRAIAVAFGRLLSGSQAIAGSVAEQLRALADECDAEVARAQLTVAGSAAPDHANPTIQQRFASQVTLEGLARELHAELTERTRRG